MIKRMEGELFYDYCARRIVEQEEQKEKLKPRVVWTSAIIIPDPNDKLFADGSHKPDYLRKLVKVSVRGAFNRSLGHTMPNSLYEKAKRERLIRKLRRKGVIDAS